MTAPQLEFKRVGQAFDGSAKAASTIIALGRAITSSGAASILVKGGLAVSRASGGALVLFTHERRELRLVCSVGRQDSMRGEQQRLPLSARVPLVDAVRSRQELWIENPDELTDGYPELVREPGAHAWAVLPLMVDGVVLGAVGWSFPYPRPRHGFSVSERTCLRALARAGSHAIYRAHLYEFERSARAAAEIARLETAARLEAVQSECERLVAEQSVWELQTNLERRRESLLTEVSVILDSSADANSVLDQVAHLSLPLLGDWCEVELVADADHLQLAAMAHIEPSKDDQLRHIRRPRPARERRLPRELLEGRPLAFSVPVERPKRVRGMSARELGRLHQIGLRRALCVPLRIHGRSLGLLTFGSEDAARNYAGVDLALATELARRCAASVEYSRLFNTVQAATQAREDFVAATSHELRTPLSHIKGFVSTLLTTDTEWDRETRDDFLREIEHEADRLTTLVENLLDMSRTDSGGQDRADQTTTPPTALVAAGVDRVRVSLGDHPLEIQVSDNLPPVWVDASQVERVIANLLENAAKYSPPGEPIGVVGRVVGDMVSLRLEDRGLGIPPEHLERIFEPFFREPTGGYPSKPGTGLGLAICRSIIRAQGGRIWAEQRLGGGTAFEFTLPIVGSRRG